MPEFNPEMPETAEANMAARDLAARPAEVWDEATSAWRRAVDTVSREMEERPARTALISLGAGYLLGGGLFTPLTGRLIGTGLKLALRTLALPALTAGAVGLGKHLLGDDEDRAPRFD